IKEFSPHILHFIGHGQIYGSETALELFNNATGQKEVWTPKAIRNDGLPETLRLVVVNACRSSTQGESAALNRLGLRSVTEAFLRVGVPAVLGMRSDVAGADAVRFGATFYGALAAGEAVDVAVTRGRQAVYREYADGLERREWAAPCLVVSR